MSVISKQLPFSKNYYTKEELEADLFNGTVSIGTWKNGQIVVLEKLYRTGAL